MNNLQDLIKRLSAIGRVNEAEEKCPDCGCAPCECDDKEKVEEAKKPDDDNDGVPNWADKKPGVDDNEEKVDEGAMDKLKALGKKALDTLGHKDDEELIKDMQKQQGQEPTGKKPEPVKEDATLSVLRHLAGITECGEEYPSSGEMSPMTVTGQEQPHMGIPAEVMAQMAANPEGEIEPEGPHIEVPMAAEAPKATYTLNITNGDNNLSMTTDVPDEIIHIMKLAGVNKGAEVSKKEAPAAGEEQEVEESGYENTPDNTKARDPQAHGDIRDWGRKGTANASTHYTPAKQGDNPMNEQRMFDDYKNFKAGK